jgi:hypothetical protein
MGYHGQNKSTIIRKKPSWIVKDAAGGADFGL